MNGIVRYLYTHQSGILKDDVLGKSIVLSNQYFSPRPIFIIIDEGKIKLIEKGCNGELFNRYANKIGKIY